LTTLADAYDALAEAAATVALRLREGATTPPDALSGTQAPSFEELPFDDFEDTPQGRSKSGGCPVHGVPWTVKAAGVSKTTGAPYSAFWKCAETNSDGSFCKEKPTLAWVKAHPAR